MRHRLQILALAAWAAFGLQATIAASQAQPSQTRVEVTGLDAGAALDLALNGGKIGDGTAGANGQLVLNASLPEGARARVSVWVDRCEDGKIVRVQLVIEGGAEPPKDEDCDRKLAGWFWSNARRVTINAARGTVQTSGRLSPRTIGIIGAGVGGGLLLLGGGDDLPNNSVGNNTPNNQTPGGNTGPGGSYSVTTVCTRDDGGHFNFVRLMTSGVLTTGLVNVTMTVSGPAGSNWVSVSGTWDSSTNRFSLTGRGTVAGISNVAVRFDGSISASGAMSGEYTMGTGGELPGGRSIVYQVTGQRQ